MKKVISLLLVLVMVVNFCACWSNSESTMSEAEKAALLKFFRGFWKYEDSDRYIFINDDNTWESRDADLFIISEGNCFLDGKTLVLKAEDNSTAYTLKQDGSKWLVDDEGKTLARYEGEDPEEEEADISPFLGMWKYDELDILIGINADGTWAMYDVEGNEESRGVCYMRDYDLVMEDGNGFRVNCMTLGSDDRIYDDQGDPLSPYVEPSPYTPSAWFEDHDLYVNYSYGDTSKTVVGGAAVRGSETNSYTRIPVEWYVEQTSYQSTGDGNCLITLTATAFSEGITMPSFVYNESYNLTWSWSLCDYYCGVILTESEDDTFYSYNYESNGETIHIEFSYSHEFTKYSDLSYELELTLTIRMPENYDGLVLACYNAPASYEIKLQNDLIYEGSRVLPVDQLPGWREIETGLICRINNY